MPVERSGRSQIHDMSLLHTAVLLNIAFLEIRGDENSLMSAAEKMIPARLALLRDSLIDQDLYQQLGYYGLGYLLPTDSKDPVCREHSNLYRQGLLADELWAIKMFDSSSKLGSGLLEGNFQLMGNFDECLEVDGPDGLFTGQLCMVTTHGLIPQVVPKQSSNISGVPMLDIEPIIAVCVPSTCSFSAVEAHWDTVLKSINGSAVVTTMDCSRRGDNPLGVLGWITVTVIAALFLSVVSSTAYDYWVNHQPTKGRRILTCFSLHANMGKLLNSQRHADSLDILDGIRVVATCCVVMTHRFMQNTAVPNHSLGDIEKYITHWSLCPVLNGQLAVEVFLLLSGCLLTYHFLNARAKEEPFHLGYFYYKRILRLLPLTAFVVLLEVGLWIHLSDGPLWSRLNIKPIDRCIDYWWSTLLFINNYVNPYNICVGATWYLSMDMQLYVLSPLILLPLAHSRAKGLLLLVSCYIATIFAAFYNAYSKELRSGSHITVDRKTERNIAEEFILTHVRAASWLLGLALGYILHRWREDGQNWRISKGAKAVGWIVSISLILIAIYSIAPFQKLDWEYSPIIDSLHLALVTSVFSIGVLGVILLSVIGKEGVVRSVLGWAGFRPLVTLSYGVYLIQLPLQRITIACIRQPYVFNLYNLFTDICSDLVICNLAALLLYLAIEAPSWQIGQWLYTPPLKNSRKPTKENTGTLDVSKKSGDN